MRMSRILLLVVALVAGGLAAFLATRTPEAPVPAQPLDPKVIEEARVQVLVATAPIGVGQRLSGTNIQWRDWPQGAVLDDYVTKEAMPEALSEMTGTVARFEIFSGDPIRQQKLVKSDQGYLSAVLAKGMRGVSIGINAESASGGFVVPNDHVDVVLTRETAEGPRAETIVANVRVLAIDKRLGEVGKSAGQKDGEEDPDAKVFSSSAIATLELDPGQAETVINATQMGRLSLALRSIVDFGKNADDSAGGTRNAAIRVIRYGVQQNVVTGTSGGPQVDPAAYSPPPPVLETQNNVELRSSVSDEQPLEQ